MDSFFLLLSPGIVWLGPLRPTPGNATICTGIPTSHSMRATRRGDRPTKARSGTREAL